MFEIILIMFFVFFICDFRKKYNKWKKNQDPNEL